MYEPSSEHLSAENDALMQPDERREPALERAMPADAIPGSTIPENTEAEVQLQDGSRVWCQVIGQRRDRHGRWRIGIRWYASPSIGGREGWYLCDPGLIRRPDGLSGRGHAGEHGRRRVDRRDRGPLADRPPAG
jgi:hypothetical protein